jgi:hypothetical protein
LSKLLCVDIETAPLDGVEQYLGQIHAPGNYTKQESIDKYVAEKTEEEKNKAALDPDIGRIVAISFQLQGETEVRGAFARDEAEEKALLTRWWAFVQRHSDPFKITYTGYNIASFDIPFLLRRSQFLGVPAPAIRLGRYGYQMPQVKDVMLELTMDRHEKFRMRSKDWWVRRLDLAGVENPCTGADVAALIALGDFDTVLTHCKADVANEVLIAQWLGLWPEAA